MAENWRRSVRRSRPKPLCRGLDARLKWPDGQRTWVMEVKVGPPDLSLTRRKTTAEDATSRLSSVECGISPVELAHFRTAAPLVRHGFTTNEINNICKLNTLREQSWRNSFMNPVPSSHAKYREGRGFDDPTCYNFYCPTPERIVLSTCVDQEGTDTVNTVNQESLIGLGLLSLTVSGGQTSVPGDEQP
ncbi:hypothetical protein EVAR_14967_1 [Eumeta japonica]|uniref:Uncharacterized protein n=1 Tax=Eumeta variegata TaxID=151549 RepID=A0A4C1XLY5_EUMVA|nr:hypothetical protein EVAR_14967_1 [Eumeta japonica]